MIIKNCLKIIKKRKNIFLLIFIFLIALSFRVIGLNWDQGNHLNPDERFLTMVSTDIKLPINIFQYFDTQKSPLNPANNNYGFFVYGTFPLFLTKFIAVVFHVDTYDKIYLVGRILSGIFDSFNIIILYFISKKIFKSKSKIVFLSSIIYTFSVLPIQLAHFYTVDSFLNFFIILTFCFLCYNRFFLSSITFGLALACKISAVYFCPIIFIFYLLFLFCSKSFKKFLLKAFVFLFGMLAIFRIFQPYAFIDLYHINPLFIDNFKTLQSYSGADTWYPPSIQWINKVPLLYTLQNITFWGIGLPIFISFFVLLILFFKKNKIISLIKKTNPIIFIILAWILLLYFYQGSQFSHSMRYFLPLYAFVFILFSYFVFILKTPKIILNLILFFHICWGLLFISIYSRPHSRVQASQWIYKNISIGSTITVESWDDALPITLSSQNFLQQYSLITLNLYDMDTANKWEKINYDLNSVDYIVMSSNRLWASIPKVPQKYPISTNFYQNLFDEKLGFKKVNETNSYPGIYISFLNGCYYLGPSNFPYGSKNNKWFSFDPNCNYPGFYIRDDIAEEAFTVYDHPKVIIFKKIK